MCTLLRNKLAQVKHWKNEVKVEKSASPPSLLRLKASPSWNLTSPGTKMARLPYCRDVTVLLWRVFRFAAITVPRSRMLATDASFFSVNSTASRWDLRLWRQWGEGMWAYVSIEPAVYNFVRHRAFCNAVLLFFSQVSAPSEDTATRGRRLLAALLTDQARWCEDWRRGTVIRQWVKLCVYQVIFLYNMLR